ncbi:ribokinase [Brachybacterium ginsengisoli]|uniref:Ribokinase n=1 Tax=Brachybacterium ginsengisoli TaxID=1331682 RepID=A0A291H0A9_9MICO|nr:ribokinase [Brachybacterium ginsengisoli]ATG55893.1 ribokinase [Brachybacterium ginsengisoli]
MTAQNRTGEGRILVVGSVNVDLVLGVARHPQPGETIAGTGSRRSPGGKGANQACAAARLGGDVRFAGRTGAGPDAELALALLHSAGADLTAATEIPDEETGLAVVTVDESGENSIVIIAGANGSWTPQDVQELRAAVAESDLVVSQGEIPAAAVDELARLCTDTGTRFLLNLAPVIEVEEGTLTAADPLVVNESEGRLALSSLTGAEAPDDDMATVRGLRDAGIRSVVMTRGARGAILAVDAEISEISSPVVHSVDTTGAGDAFVGALALGLARGESAGEAGRRAARVGAFAVTRHGAQPSYPGREDELPE